MSGQEDGVRIDELSPASRHLLRWGWRRPLGSRQFRLATVFVIVTILATTLALWKHWHDQQAPYRALRALGADLRFSDRRRWVHVDLSGSSVTDDKLNVLRQVPVKTHLDLSGTTVTDNVIDQLIQAAQLVRVDLTRTKVSDAGIQRLLDARPDVSVGPTSDMSYLKW